MSKGMWTKHFSTEGKVYYYNAALQKSLWSPPQDSVVHEAINAKWTPPKIEPEGEVEEGQIKCTDISPTPSQAPAGYPMQMPPFPPGFPPIPPMMHMMPPNNMMNMPPMPFPPGMSVGMPPMFMPENLPHPAAFSQHATPAAPSGSTSNPPPTDAEIQTMKNQQAALDIQAKIDQALQQKQRDITTAKRFKKANPEDDVTSQQSTYLKQKSDLESMSGSKSDDSSKWFVR